LGLVQGKNFRDNNMGGLKIPSTEGTLAFSNRQYYFPEKTKVFPAPKGLVPAQTKKKEKIGTIFWEQT
jgi:hypothetical protein